MPPKPSLAMSGSDWPLLLVLSMLWGGSFFFAKIALAAVPPLTLALYRVAIAAAILLLVVRALRLAMPGRDQWGAVAVVSLVNNVLPFTLIFWGQTHITSGLASILNATTPLFGVIVAHLATSDDKLTVSRVVGLTVGFAGVVIMLGPDLLGDLGANVLAQLACLLAAFLYAVSGVYARRFRHMSPTVVAAAQMCGSTLMLLPLAFVFDRPWALPSPSGEAIAAIVGLAALSTVLAYLIYYRVLARAGATNLLLVTFLIPVSAILLGVLFLDETLLPRQIAGMAAIALGLAAIDGRPAQFLAGAFRTRPAR